MTPANLRWVISQIGKDATAAEAALFIKSVRSGE